MKRYCVYVIDGKVPTNLPCDTGTEPSLTTSPAHIEVLSELMRREPLFHRYETGTTRGELERVAAPEFWEVSPFGDRLSREFVLRSSAAENVPATEHVWEIENLHCSEIAADNYLLTYTLFQGERVTRRATIWRRSSEGWQVVYHQGTLVQ